MKLPLHDSDRELWLSRYLDGELSAEEKRAVADKVRHDSVWRAEFNELKSDETLVARVIERYHTDSPMAREVVRRIEANGSRVHARKVARRSRRMARRSVGSGWVGFLFKLTSAAALVAASLYGYRYYQAVTLSSQSTAQVPVKTPPPLPTLAPVELGNDLVFTAWPDGTQIWSRRGTVIERISDRSLQLNGEAFFHVAANPIPFSVIAPNGAHAQALGTRFDVKTGTEGARIRVAEGHVRCDAGALKVDAYGGTEILPDFHTRTFDPRALAAEWSKYSAASTLPAVADGLVPAWNQAGGSQGHTSITPVSGPANIGIKPEQFFALTGTQRLHSAAVLSAGAAPRAYVLARNAWESTQPPSEQQTTLLALELSGPHRGTWKTCASFAGFVECAPVVSPRGLVIFATPEGNVKAYDPQHDNIAWTVSANSTVFALTAANDESILCSTYAGLVALDGHNGQVHWRCNALQNIKAPVTVLADGTLCAVSEGGIVTQLDASGHVLLSKQWGTKLLDAPAAAANAADAAWLNSGDGNVARLSMHDGVLTEKSFAKQNVFGPIGSGLVGSESGLVEFTQNAAPSANAPRDTIIALVQDGRGDLFVAYRNGVQHKRATAKEPEFVHITHGEVLRHGLSLTAGMAVVTTTQGVLIFE